jgi:hypothetical protein
MEEQIMNNEVEETEIEVVDTPANTMPEIYVPEPQVSADESHGPNKALVALAIGGALLIAKPAIRKAKQIKADRKAKKEAEETERIMRVLEKTGLVVPVPEAETKPVEAAADEKPTETASAETKTEEK